MPIVNSNEIVLQVSHLKKRFGNNIVLDDFSFQLHRNENIVVLGKSGSGKSVLIKCIIGLMKPDEGDIYILGKQVNTMNLEELDKTRAKIGFLFQSNALYDSMTVRENLEFPLRRHSKKNDKKEIEHIIKQALEDVKLTHTIDMMPSELSGGMRKRIALARTLILKPEIILYDEPTTGLDPITAKEIIQLMIEIKQKYNTASLIISHDMNCVKLASDLVVLLIGGKCYANDTYSNLINTQDKNIKQFFE